jgi:hypothetical protein
LLPWLLPHLLLLRRNHPGLGRWLILRSRALLAALHRCLRSHLLLLWRGTHGRRALYFLSALLSLWLDLLLLGRMALLL